MTVIGGYINAEAIKLLFFAKDIPIGGWQLKLKHSDDTDADEVAHYKFHRSLQLKAGQTCTVRYFIIVTTFFIPNKKKIGNTVAMSYTCTGLYNATKLLL